MNDGTTKTAKEDTKRNGLTDQVGDVRDMVVEIKDKVGDVKAKVFEVKDTVIEKAGSTADRIKRFTVANPIKAVAIAFVVGYFGMRVTRPLRFF